MKIRKRNRRNLVALLLALLMVATTLIGCSSTAAEPAKETKGEETRVAVKEEKVEVAEVKEAEPTPEPTPEPTAEPTPEPTPEPIVYEGIDMESTLPGKEWMNTFKDIILEPKLIVFNDETNKKIILEDGGEIFFEDGDVLALYAPNEEKDSQIFGPVIERAEGYTYYTIYFFDKDSFYERNKFKMVLNTGEELTCIMIADFD